jgi:biotin carboxyl carrier protein
MEYTFYYKGREYTISVSCKSGTYSVSIGKQKFAFEAIFIDTHTISLKNDNKTILCRVVDNGVQKTVIADGELFEFEEQKERAVEVKTPGKAKKPIDKMVKSPMPGSVVKLNVKQGDTVKEGDILIIVEAMKMENELRSPGNMKVKKVHVKEGEQVEGFAPLLELE